MYSLLGSTIAMTTRALVFSVFIGLTSFRLRTIDNVLFVNELTATVMSELE